MKTVCPFLLYLFFGGFPKSLSSVLHLKIFHKYLVVIYLDPQVKGVESKKMSLITIKYTKINIYLSVCHIWERVFFVSTIIQHLTKALSYDFVPLYLMQ